jgi:hypothetical protein
MIANKADPQIMRTIGQNQLSTDAALRLRTGFTFGGT